MDVSVILTYRCNSRCSTCHVWQHPTLPAEEVTLAVLAKLPGGLDRLVLTGGEPTLRADLGEIVDCLRPKARQLEISTNGLQADKLEPIAAKHPDVRFRLSLDGLGARNDSIRGEKNGFERKMATLRRLVAAGARDLGFAATLQDENADQLLELYRLCSDFGGELAVAALHNGFLYHKIDNESANRVRLARAVQPLIAARLRSRRPRNWFRAHSELGLMRKILGQPRGRPCTAGRDCACVDPWGRVYACPIRPDLEIGDLAAQTWREILRGPRAAEARTRVARCTHNCWPAGTAGRPGRFPGLRPFAWIAAHRLRGVGGGPVDFDREVDFADVAQSPVVPRRESWLGKPFRPAFQRKSERPYGAFNNGMNR
jgi:MoaA/NifB/PqqE/SkfB family radical SAM enzyme